VVKLQKAAAGGLAGRVDADDAIAPLLREVR
jgi:hypothetical protein